MFSSWGRGFLPSYLYSTHCLPCHLPACRHILYGLPSHHPTDWRRSDFCGHHRHALLAPWQPPLPRCCSWQRSAALSRSVMSDSATPWTVAHQAPQSMAFSKHEYWSGLQFPPPGDPPNSGIEPMSPVSPALAGGFFITEPPGKPISALCVCVCVCVYYIYPLLHKLPS